MVISIKRALAGIVVLSCGLLQPAFTEIASGATLTVGVGKQYALPSQAFAAAQDGDTIAIDAGTYTDDFATITPSNLLIQSVGGRAHLAQSPSGVSPNGKGIWVSRGNNITIDGFEFSGAHVPPYLNRFYNGSGIRIEGVGITIRNCYFHDNQDGVLAIDADLANGPITDVLISNSEFNYNGDGSGYEHNIYIGHVRSFTLIGSWSHNAHQGHLVKSWAYKNVIAYNRITDEATGTASYEIDLPYGGETYIIGNLIEKGLHDVNHTAVITYADSGDTNPTQALYVVNNTVVNDNSYSTYFVWTPYNPAGLIANNIFVGPGGLSTGLPAVSNLMTLTDPGLVSLGTFDYHLTDGSPAIDAGYNPGTSPTGMNLTPTSQYVHPTSTETRTTYGARIDIGAYEYNPTLPTATLAANPPSIVSGGSSTLSWSSTNATNCSGTGFPTGGATSGSITAAPSTTTIYLLTCDGTGGSASASATVTVSALAPTASLSANPSTVMQGQSSTLAWSSTNATSCTGTNFNTSNATSGSTSVTPTTTTTYFISCAGSGGTADASATVTVSAPAFGNNVRVKTTQPTPVYSKPNTTSGKVLCTQDAQASGTIVGSSHSAQGFIWWNVNFDTRCHGWVQQGYLSTN
jgi:hypothetical protein